eukprot:m.17126 g.17126  ORF g.17126 m.17126 type:complete len:443 (-) comp11353_c0_seq1:65-1393(-)
MSTISKLFQKTVAGTNSQVPFSATATYHGWVVVPLSEHVRFSDRASVIAIAQRILSHKKSSKATGEKVTIDLNPNHGLKIQSVGAVLKEEMLTQNVPDDWQVDNEDPDVLSFDYNEAKNPDYHDGDGEEDAYANREGMELLNAEPNAIVCVVLSKDKGLCGVITSSIDESGDACLGCDVLGFSSNKGSVAFAAAYKHLTTQFQHGSTVAPTLDPLDDTTSTTSSVSSSSSIDSNPSLDSTSSNGYTTTSITSSTTSSTAETTNSTNALSPLRTASSPLAQNSHTADHAVEPSALLTNSGHFTHLSPPSYPSSPGVSPRSSPNGSFKTNANKLSPPTITPSPTNSPKLSPKSSRNWSTKLYRRGSPRSKQKKVLTGMSNVFVKRASSVDLSEADSGYLRTETITQILRSEVNGERDTYLVCNCSNSQPNPTHARVGFVAVHAS